MIKPGIHTSEFVVIVLTIIGNVIAASIDAIKSAPAQHVSWASVGLAAAYGLYRSAVKIAASWKQGSN